MLPITGDKQITARARAVLNSTQIVVVIVGIGLVSTNGYLGLGLYGFGLHSSLATGLNGTQICLAYGGSCLPAASCTTLYLYALHHHSTLVCNTTTDCCLTAIGFYSLYRHHGHHHGYSGRQHGYKHHHG